MCVAAVLLTGCAPAASITTSQERAQAASPRSKTITIGIQRGLPDFSPFTTQSTGGASSNIPPMVNDGLSYTDERIVAHPLKAMELPSTEKGTWKIFEDGRTETTWKLRPNVFWHDGTQQTPADYQFTFDVYRDRDLPRRGNAAVLAQSGIAFPDPLTMVISWSSPHIDAGTIGPGPSGETSAGLLPKHILEDPYLNDKTGAFMNHSYWTHEYISDGPYKIVSWDPNANASW